MLTDIDLLSSIPKALFQSQAPLSDAKAAPGEVNTLAVSQTAILSIDGDLGYSFAPSTTSLRGLGLRLPGNAGDSEALLLLIDLVSGRLSNDNEGQKGVSQNISRRSTLSEMQLNYKDLVTIRGAIQNLTAQRTELIAEKSSLQGELATQQTRERDRRDLVAALSIDPDASTEQLSNAQLQLESVVAAVNSLESELSGVGGQIDRIAGEIAQNQALEASALQFIATTFKFVNAIDETYLNKSKDDQDSYTKEIREYQQSEIFEQIDRIYDLDREDLSIEDAVAENDVNRRYKELLAFSAGLSSIIYAAMDVIAQEKSNNQLDLHALAQVTNGGNRLQLSL